MHGSTEAPHCDLQRAGRRMSGERTAAVGGRGAGCNIAAARERVLSSLSLERWGRGAPCRAARGGAVGAVAPCCSVSLRSLLCMPDLGESLKPHMCHIQESQLAREYDAVPGAPAAQQAQQELVLRQLCESGHCQGPLQAHSGSRGPLRVRRASK